MKTKIHGNAGNQNAVKEFKLDCKLQFRAYSADRQDWAKAAAKEGKTLTQWVTDTLNEKIS